MHTLKCPHCGKDAFTIETVGPTEKMPTITVTRTKVAYCRCGHPKSWHDEATGRCKYNCGCDHVHGRREKTAVTNGASTLGKCERAILQAVSSGPRSRAAVAIVSGYSVDSGGFAAALAKLRALELIVGPASGIMLTVKGGQQIGPVPPLPRGQQLVSYWVERVGVCAGSILQVLSTAYPSAVERSELALRTGYSASSGGFAAALAKLRTLELVDGMRASDALMTAVQAT